MLMNVWIISIFVIGASALSDDCEGRRDLCWARSIHNQGVPGTQEQYDGFCDDTIKYLDCVIKALTECNSETDKDLQAKELQEYKVVLPIIKSVCDKESDIYKDIVKNIECLKDVATQLSDLCYTMKNSENALKNFEALLVSNGVTDVSNLDKCFQGLFLDTCLLGSAGFHCGVKARDVAVQLTQMFVPAYGDECEDMVKDNLPEIARAMELEFKGASANDDVDCDAVPNKCWGNRNEELPGSREELDSYCEDQIKYMECIDQDADKCEGNENIQENKKLLQVLRNVCDKESDIYQDVAENVQCFKSVFMDHSGLCSTMGDKKNSSKNFENLLVENGVTDISNMDTCFNHLFIKTCLLGAVGVHCGTKARDVAVQLSQMFDTGNECNAKVLDNLSEVAKAMELEYRVAQKELLENTEEEITK